MYASLFPVSVMASVSSLTELKAPAKVHVRVLKKASRQAIVFSGYCLAVASGIVISSIAIVRLIPV